MRNAERCRNPNAASFEDYGGILVCARWQRSFEFFLEHMGPRPDGGTLERIDVNGHYEPGNCRWASALEQANNRRNNRLLTLNGETKTMAEWARVAGMSKRRLEYRLSAGWSLDEALTKGFSRGYRRDLSPQQQRSP